MMMGSEGSPALFLFLGGKMGDVDKCCYLNHNVKQVMRKVRFFLVGGKEEPKTCNNPNRTPIRNESKCKTSFSLLSYSIIQLYC